jgi:hypothetical protein
MSRPKPMTTEQYLRDQAKTMENLNRRPIAARVQFGTVDASWSGTGNPLVKVDGESFVRQPGMPYSADYTPVKGDRVYLIPSINGFIIGNKIVGI